MKKHLLLLSLIYASICNSQVLTINVSENNFGIDETLSIIVSRIQNINYYQDLSGYDEIVITFGESNYSFASMPNNLEYSNSYLVINGSNSNQYTLYFTPLPIVSIESNNTIVDEPKVLASFTYSDEEQTTTSNIGIELRGGHSQSFPKKTYDIEFWDDDIGDETADMQFGELRDDDDWILDALYNEPLRIRSYIANKLWKELHTPYYIGDEPKAKSGADVMYVEMFLNEHYNGLYNLSEQVDKKQLKVKKFNGDMKGELYKSTSWGGANTFNSLPYFNNNIREWGGYEFKHPDEDQITDWQNLYQFTDFVMNSSESDFTDSIWSKFVEDNFIDYFLFLNLIRAPDNTGKNIYLAKYKINEPYFYVPWDLDGCFGTIWDGTNEGISNDILINGFISRILKSNVDDILLDISNRWFNYRDNLFNDEALSSSIYDQYNFLKANKVYERESLVYSNYDFENDNLSYMLNWLENRLEYLDIYFKNDFLIYKNGSLTKEELILYPNPNNGLFYINTPFTQEEIIKIKLVDNIGKSVFESSFTNGNKVDIPNPKKGVYFISIVMKDKILTQKVIVK